MFIIMLLAKAFLTFFFALVIKITHETILKLESFTWLFLMLFQSDLLLQILVCLIDYLIV